MKTSPIYLGKTKLQSKSEKAIGEYIELSGESFYKISNYDKMDSFLMTIASSSDHWMYISSRGGLTAGRKNPDNAIFPYYTDDIIHHSGEITGNKTIIKITGEDDKLKLWEPFSEKYYGIYSISRNLYKNIYGTKIIFEEINHDLELTFSYSWTTTEEYGFVKESEIINNSKKERVIHLLDGIQNILPSRIYQKLQNDFSTLVDAYKKNELISEDGLGIYSLSSIPSDRAEPNESLSATLVWSIGVTADQYLLSSRQLQKFRENKHIETEENIKGIRGSYFIVSGINLRADSNHSWRIITDINKDLSDLVKLRAEMLDINRLKERLICDIKLCQEKLIRIVAEADGLQLTNTKFNVFRHFSNVLFNVMRGGIFKYSYKISKKDFIKFLQTTNPYVVSSNQKFIDDLSEFIPREDLLKKVAQTGDNHFIKLFWEYLPLSFSRRHGDPSRPWNLFSINLKDESGERILDYQGNWRDIFQNWEALALSYPMYVESMIVKFLNASTADGYNPYRVTRDGFDWEIQEPENPWANIGYWGDHQVIYLTKLLELSSKYNPVRLQELAQLNIFAYANVPYRIKSYEEILIDPHNTIEFDTELDRELKQSSEIHGTDSKFIKNNDDTLVQVSLIEKLLIVLLVRMSNFIPGAGIWMNTQRPEWNDANNALVGNGVSMVTLYYLRRFISYISRSLNSTGVESFLLTTEVHNYFYELISVLKSSSDELKDITAQTRKRVLDGLGFAGTKYRESVYNNGFSSERKSLSKSEIQDLLRLCEYALDLTIKSNKRSDGLYHSYNILHISSDKLEVTHLYEMLEGQVAVLSSGCLSVEESKDVIEALRKSKLYRKDQDSYMLYPDKRLPDFIEKNIISADSINSSELAVKLLNDPKNGIIEKSFDDNFHFNSALNNSSALKNKLRSYCKTNNIELEQSEVDQLLEIYEDTFNHKEFTGRSGTFYKYEGLGSIYWHMVSKLLLAVQEIYFTAVESGAADENIEKLKEYYYDIKAGIGAGKSPDKYGAFPTDAYSHTPSFAGVQQPGMTGQVKEDIISRFGELGLVIQSSKIIIKPSLLKKEEFTTGEELFNYYDLTGNERSITIEKNSIAFTICQVPFIYRVSDSHNISVIMNDKKQINTEDLEINEELSHSIFNREGKIKQVEVFLKL